LPEAFSYMPLHRTRKNHYSRFGSFPIETVKQAALLVRIITFIS